MLWTENSELNLKNNCKNYFQTEVNALPAECFGTCSMRSTFWGKRPDPTSASATVLSSDSEHTTQSLPAATKLGQGNVFTGVCDSVRGGGCLPQCMLGYHTPQSRHTPPWTRHPTAQTIHPSWDQTPLRSRHPQD